MRATRALAGLFPLPLGTIMMSGCGILTNGKGTRREYCEFSLDELQVRGGRVHRGGPLSGAASSPTSLPRPHGLCCGLEQGLCPLT